MQGLLKRKAATYSPTSAVPSAQTGLTSLFGMGRGEPRRYNHLKSVNGHLVTNQSVDSTSNNMTYPENKNVKTLQLRVYNDTKL